MSSTTMLSKHKGRNASRTRTQGDGWHSTETSGGQYETIRGNATRLGSIVADLRKNSHHKTSVCAPTGTFPCCLCGKPLIDFSKPGFVKHSYEFHYAPCGMPCAGRRLTSVIWEASKASKGSHTINRCTTCGEMPEPHDKDLKKNQLRFYKEWIRKGLEKQAKSFDLKHPV